jgi:hypothetical protein
MLPDELRAGLCALPDFDAAAFKIITCKVDAKVRQAQITFIARISNLKICG